MELQPLKTSTLPTETQFAIASFNTQVDKMNLDQARDICKQLYRLNQAQKHVFMDLLKGR